jgi:hypothetical protein
MFKITFDPNLYRGSYWIRSLDTDAVKERRWGPFCGAFKRGTCWLGQGRYALSISPGAELVFYVDQNGLVSAPEANALRCSGSVIEFVTRPFVIDPGAYAGSFRIEGVESDDRSNAFVGHLLPGITSVYPDGGYSVRLEHSNGFRFNVSADGDLSLNAHNTQAGTASGTTLTFNVAAIEIDPANYYGEWSVLGAERAPARGRRTILLVPHVRGYLLSIGPGSVALFDVDANGEPSPHEVSIPVDGEGKTFRLTRSQQDKSGLRNNEAQTHALIWLRHRDGVRQSMALDQRLPDGVAPGDLVLMPFNGTPTPFFLVDKQWTSTPDGWTVEHTVVFAERDASGEFANSRRTCLTGQGWL